MCIAKQWFESQSAAATLLVSTTIAKRLRTEGGGGRRSHWVSSSHCRKINNNRSRGAWRPPAAATVDDATQRPAVPARGHASSGAETG